jgi:hypothetical protein
MSATTEHLVLREIINKKSQHISFIILHNLMNNSALECQMHITYHETQTLPASVWVQITNIH